MRRRVITKWDNEHVLITKHVPPTLDHVGRPGAGVAYRIEHLRREQHATDTGEKPGPPRDSARDRLKEGDRRIIAEVPLNDTDIGIWSRIGEGDPGENT